MSNSNKDFKEKLWDTIRSEIHPNNVHGESQLSVRCPFCGDSHKNLNSTHFYIKIDVNNNEEPVLFNCVRCDTGGVLSPQVMRMLEVHDIHINSELTSYNKKAVKSIYRSIGLKDNELKLKIQPSVQMDNTYIRNKKYIENRLGRSFTFEELEKLKVVLKFSDFLKFNKIEQITCHPKKAIMLNNDYVGFLTVRNEFINFRQVENNNKYGRRYEKYKVVPNLDNTRKFYSIPNQIDLMTPEPIVINIAEGVFDILGVFYHLHDGVQHNMIHVAACGAGFINVILYFIKKGIVGNVIINLYSDSDRSPQEYRKLYNQIKPWVHEINLFYNEKEKDYGVPLNRIKLIKKKIPIR